jgi:hypothetical protein
MGDDGQEQGKENIRYIATTYLYLYEYERKVYIVTTETTTQNERIREAQNSF